MFAEFIFLDITNWFDANYIFQWVVDNASYLLVFILMVVESSFIPFPSEVIIPPAAYLSYTDGNLNIYMIILVATAGAIVGALINYYLALWIGRPIVYRFADSRFGHACLLNREKVQKAENYFDKHGAVSTFIGRLIPAVRQLISIPAGLARMNLPTFIAFTALGAGLWNSILAALGYWLGHAVPRELLHQSINKYNSYLTWAGLALGAVIIVFLVWQFIKPKKNASH
ncbi:MAG: DedA family protein [Paramuribaculum sp.]|nr:DedA family protein [Paramuribaculum sp.]